MARNGTGTYNLPAGNPVVSGTVISSSWANTTLTDIGTALTQSIAKDGQTNPTANLPMATYRHTGVGAATALTDYARYDQLQNSTPQWLASVSGVDTITAAASPTPSAYAAGQTFRFVSAGANTGAVTLNVSSLGAKAITKNGTTALTAGDIPSGAVVQVTYDGTQFQLRTTPLADGDKGDITVSASGKTWTIDNQAVTYGKIQDVSATSRILGRKTAGAGSAEECTLSEVLDFIGSAAQGDILYRGASGWARLGAGTSGYFLQTLGAGANPAWAAASTGLTLGTPVASTSGTAIDFTSIPSGTKLIIISFDGISTSGTSLPIIQIGDSGGIETSGYNGSSHLSTSTQALFSSGFSLTNTWQATFVAHGSITLTLLSSSANTWSAAGVLGLSNAAGAAMAGGAKSLSATLDRVRITTVGGTDTFDAGLINIAYM